MDINAENSTLASQARMLDRKRDELSNEENRLSLDAARVARDGARALTDMKSKIDADSVTISRNGEQQLELSRRLNSERVKSTNDSAQQNFNVLAADTAKRITEIRENAFNAIENQQRDAMERVTQDAKISEDPFYRLKTMSPIMSEKEDGFEIKVALPAHEAKNLLVAGDGKTVKLTLARRFQEDYKNPETHGTVKTNNFQTIVDELVMPSVFDTKKVSRSYQDGIVTIEFKKPLTLEAVKAPASNDSPKAKS